MRDGPKGPACSARVVLVCLCLVCYTLHWHVSGPRWPLACHQFMEIGRRQKMTCYRFKEWEPKVDDSAYVAPGSTVIGWVALHARSSVWPGAVIRGDNEPITVGEGSNIQDGAVLHTDPGCPLTIGGDVTVGHQAMLHGRTIEDGALIGIQAVVLNKAVIGRQSLVGAGAVVTEGKVFPERSLILGAPARVVRTLTDEEVANMQSNARVYVERASEYKTDLSPV